MLPLVRGRPQHMFLLQRLDGLLVTGSGSDLAPQSYGEQQRYPFQQMSEERAQLELGLARLAFKSLVPTFGICGGMQSMNVALGGTLIQDIPAQIVTRIQHLPKKSAEKMAHLVHIEPKTLLRRIIKKSTMSVNSSHHQSVKTFPSSFHISAVAPDGVIEAIEATEHPFWLGVQWHPEFLYRNDVLQKRLFSAFMKAARHYACSNKAFI